MGICLSAVCCAGNAACCCAKSACSCCGKAVGKNSIAVRIIYAVIFLLCWVAAWALRTWGSNLLPTLDNIAMVTNYHLPCEAQGTLVNTSAGCFGVPMVYRMAFVMVLYHLLFALLTIKLSSSSDKRIVIQNGLWFVKVLLILGLFTATLFMNNDIFYVFSFFCAIAAGLFSLFMIYMLINFLYNWNQSWLEKAEEEGAEGICSNKWLAVMMVISILAYIGTIVILALSYAWYSRPLLDNPPANISGYFDCASNTAFTTITLIMIVIVFVLTLLPKIPKASLLVSAGVSLYASYLMLSGIVNNPAKGCDGFGYQFFSGSVIDYVHQALDDSNVSATDVISVVIAVVMIIYSAFRMGRRRGEEPEAVAGDRGDIELQKDEKEDDEEDVDDEKEGLTYNPTFFHLVLATGSCVIATGLSGWSFGAGSNEEINLYGMWAKIVSQWICFLLYLWTILAPLICKNRDFD
eukprot:CAMPEP_0113874758 /NCGR_PEP_ID=MMETSP0780_2-20120614/4520_1 /TAXON_ID=652834 /ORGANISM="Palpitomonas bilix" /LENGTH=463 /DNA_ID=CAMNT_0000860583 /DNA_START=44 /DNA_END=1435 /DNA_ORIENTATION=- /assembly_acc=CAM_ASM_000599